VTNQVSFILRAMPAGAAYACVAAMMTATACSQVLAVATAMAGAGFVVPATVMSSACVTDVSACGTSDERVVRIATDLRATAHHSKGRGALHRRNSVLTFRHTHFETLPRDGAATITQSQGNGVHAAVIWPGALCTQFN